MAIKIIHINRHILASNIKNGTNEPTVTARYKYKKGKFRSNNVLIVDDEGKVVARVVCNIDKPLSCGARCYVETNLSLVDEDIDSAVRLD